MDFPGWHPWYIAWLCHAYHMAFEKTPYILSRHCSWQTTTTRLLPLLLLGYIIFNSLWCLIFHTQFATVGGVRGMWMTKMHPGPKSAVCSEWLLFYVMTGSWYYHFTCCCFLLLIPPTILLLQKWLCVGLRLPLLKALKTSEWLTDVW